MADIIETLLAALASHAAGDREAASAGARAALGLAPEQPVALQLLGVIALRERRFTEAIDLLRRADAARPGHPETCAALADAEAGAGHILAAAAEYRRLLTLRPGCPRALSSLARMLLQAGQAEEAAREAEEAARRAPNEAEPWFVLGTALSSLRHLPPAIFALERAVTLDPRHAEARLNLGNARIDAGNLAEAERDIRAALALNPRLPEAYASLGWLLAGCGRTDQAIVACTEALRLRPGFARAYWNRAFAYLLAGRYAEGWDDYEWRRLEPGLAKSFELPGREWAGEDLAGADLLVYAAQGLGDTIQLARYLPLLVARGARVTLACPRPVMRLLRDLGAEVVDREQPLPPYQLWIDQMSLPRLFGTKRATIPAADGYLAAEPVTLAMFRPRVGVVWAGNPAHSNDWRRSMPTACLRPLLAVSGVSWVSLQVGPRSGEITAQFGVADRSGQLRDLADTAALIAALDLVVAVDTSTAHLAGALGKPVWLMLPFAPDWRWMWGTDDSPWYAAATLFRQDSPGDWAGVVGRVAAALARRFPLRDVPEPTHALAIGAM